MVKHTICLGVFDHFMNLALKGFNKLFILTSVGLHAKRLTTRNIMQNHVLESGFL